MHMYICMYVIRILGLFLAFAFVATLMLHNDKKYGTALLFIVFSNGS